MAMQLRVDKIETPADGRLYATITFDVPPLKTESGGMILDWDSPQAFRDAMLEAEQGLDPRLGIYMMASAHVDKTADVNLANLATGLKGKVLTFSIDNAPSSTFSTNV